MIECQLFILRDIYKINKFEICIKNDKMPYIIIGWKIK